MSGVVMLHEGEPKDILQVAIDKEVPAIMSYLSKGKWHVAKVLLTCLEQDRLDVKSIRSSRKQQPINIQLEQPVGISFKYEYGKFVFDTTVLDLKPPSDQQSGGTIVVAVPDRIEVVQRRSYFRVNVPESLKVNVVLWHRRHKDGQKDQAQDSGEASRDYCRGRLIDISAGGAQVSIDDDCAAQGAPFKTGQFVGMRFTPMPYQTPLVLNAQIRNMLPRSDGKCIYLGLQIVGLEASIEGREVLTRLVGIVEQYYLMNQSGAKQHDLHPVPSAL
jgi:c-di-GMP-binding flagellar brake protein YcgR